MDGRDSLGRRISLVNPPSRASYDRRSPSRRYPSSRGGSSGPATPPELQRPDRYDSRSPRSDPISPLTPTMPYYDPSRTYSYGVAPSGYEGYVAVHRHGSFSDSAGSGPYEDEATPPAPATSERPPKRHPCRFRDSHGCEKTFTTSGHASRHSKIHTAEKGVQCTFPECQKKFTRADNMKQHLETHYKDKARGKSSSSSSGRRHSVSHRAAIRRRSRDHLRLDYERHGPAVPTLASPLASPATGAWDLRALHAPLMVHHSSSLPRNGLDALAMAAANQDS